MAISLGSLPPPQQRMIEGAVPDSNRAVSEFVRRFGIPLQGIRKVELKKYYDGWAVMCGNPQPHWTPHVEIQYWPERFMAIGKIMSFTIESEIEGEESSRFAEVIVDELRKHIQEGQGEDPILAADEVNAVFQDALVYLKHVHRYNDDESEFGVLVARSTFPPNQTFGKTSLVFYYAAIGAYACGNCSCVPVVDKN